MVLDILDYYSDATILLAGSHYGQVILDNSSCIGWGGQFSGDVDLEVHRQLR